MGISESFNGGNGSATPMIDKMFGSAFCTVKTVADQIDDVKYLAYNMPAISLVAENYAAIGANTDLLTTINSVVRGVGGETLSPLPAASSRINKIVSFDANGQLTVIPYTTVYAAETGRATGAENANSALITAETTRALAAEAANTALVASSNLTEKNRALAAEAGLQTQVTNNATILSNQEIMVDNYFVPGDPDWTNAFNRAFAVRPRIHGKSGAIYTVKNIDLTGRQFFGQGCVIRDAVGSSYCFKLGGWNSVLNDVQFQDQGNVAKVLSNVGGFASGAQTIAVSSVAGVQAGMTALVQGNGSLWTSTRVQSVGTNTITFFDPIAEDAGAGLQVVCSWGLVTIQEGSHSWLDKIIMTNTQVGITYSTLTSDISYSALTRVQMSDVRYLGLGIFGNTHDLKVDDVTIYCGPTETFNYTGNGTAGPFSIVYAYDLLRDVTVSVNGVAKVYGTDWTFNDNYSIVFLAGHFPAAGAAISVTHYHSGIRGFVNDMRHIFNAGGNLYSKIAVLKAIIAFDLETISLCDFVQCFADGNMYIGMFLNNCTQDVKFVSCGSTWARQPIQVYTSSGPIFTSLFTDITPAGMYNPGLPVGTYEILTDSSSYIEIDLPSWKSQTYMCSPPGSVALVGAQNMGFFTGGTSMVGGQSSYIGLTGLTTGLFPLAIMERNRFLAGFYASVNTAPGGTETVTFKIVKNTAISSSVVLATFVITGASFGGYFTFTGPITLSLGETLHVQVVYSAAAASSVPRGFVLMR